MSWNIWKNYLLIFKNRLRKNNPTRVPQFTTENVLKYPYKILAHGYLIRVARPSIFMTRIIDLRKRIVKEPIPPPVESGPVFTIPARAENKSTATREFFWKTSLFYANPKKKYLLFALAAGLLIGAGVMIFFHKNTLTAILMIVSAMVLILYANKKPTKSQVAINELGITIDNRPFTYKELKSFWIEYAPGNVKELSLESKKWYLPYTKISIENQNPIELRTMLVNFLPEKEHEISLIDIVGKKLGL